MKRLALLSAFLAIPVLAQSSDVVACKLSILNSINAKTLFGRVDLFKARNVCKNYSTADVPFGGTDIELSLGTVNTLSQSDAEALLNHSYNDQAPKKLSNVITSAAMGIGLAAAGGSPIVLSARTLAYLLFGVTFGQQVVLPFLTSNVPALDLSSPCGGIPADYVLKSGSSVACTVYVQKPPKGSTRLPATITYNIALSAPTPGPLPNPTPVQLRKTMPAGSITLTPAPQAPQPTIHLQGRLGVIPDELMPDHGRTNETVNAALGWSRSPGWRVI